MKTKVLILLIGLLAFGACTFEMEDEPTPAAPGEVSLGLYTEGGNFRVPTTRGAIDESEELGTMPWVLVFRGTTDAAVFYEAKQAVSDGSGGAKVTLRTTIDPSRILILANVPAGASFFDGTTQTVFSETALNTACATKTFAQVADGLLYTAPLATAATGGTTTSIPYDGGYLPMSAVTDLTVIDENSSLGTNAFKILLKRAVAKVTVDATAANTTDGFVLSGVSIVGSRRYGRFHQLSSSTVPTLATTGWVNYLSSGSDVIASASGNISDPLYIYESSAAETSGTVVIVKGTLPGLGTANPQYYRLSFTDTSGNAVAIQRNGYYKFTITSVVGGGYTSMTDALAATGTSNNLTAVVEVTDLSSHDIIDNGQYYLGVTNSEFMLYSDDAVSTADNIVLTSVSSDAPSSQTVTVTSSVTGGSGAFNVAITSSTPNTTAQDVVITQMDATVTAGQVIVRVGNLTKIIQVTRKSTLIFAANTIEFANEYVSAEVASQGTAGSNWLSLSLDGTTSQGEAVTQPSTAGSIYLKTTVHAVWAGGVDRRGGEVYLARHDKQGRVKVHVHQAVVNAKDVPTTPMTARSYVGAFWRAAEIGERIIRTKVDGTATDLGDWTATVVWMDDRWNPGDIVLSTTPTLDPGVTWNTATEVHKNPDVGGYYVAGNATDVAGTVPANGEIYYRIGLKTKYTPTITNPARYAVVLFAYNNNTQFTKLYLRQGENADYLMYLGDTDEDGNVFTGGRTDARRFSPYNITGATLTDAAHYVALIQNGGTEVDYPTQAGAFFQYAMPAGYIRLAYNPIIATPGLWSSVQTTAWSSTQETCPGGYSRPAGGSGSTGHEYWQSLISKRDVVGGNSLAGYYADGFFDRRIIVAGTGLGSNPASGNIMVARATKDVAYIGQVMFNPVATSSHYNASIFFPAPGARDYVAGALYNIGHYGYYATTSVRDAVSVFTTTIGKGVMNPEGHLSRATGFSLRCVAN